MPSIRHIAWAALAAAVSVHAQVIPVQRAEEVVVTASRIAEPESQVPHPVIVITGEEIRQAGQMSLPQLLQSRAGLQIIGNGGLGQPSGVQLRGTEARHTLILVDGLRVDSATAGTTALEHIPLSQIARIEIVPGAMSSLYGSDAIGGVIQVFTKGARPPAALNATAGAGSFGTANANGGVSGSAGGFDYSLNLGYLESDSFSATKPSEPFGSFNPDDDGYRNKSVSGKLAWHIARDQELGATAFRADANTHFDSGLATDDVNDQTLAAYSLYARNRLADGWTSLLRAGTSEDEVITSGAFPSRFRTRQDQFLWQNDVAAPVGTVAAGLEYLEQRVSGTTAFTVSSRTVRSGFAGYQGGTGSHSWQLNARYDDNSQFGGHWTGLAGYGLRLADSWQVTASLGNAFKAPSFNDLYFPTSCFFGFCFASNPDLQPEKSRSAEAGIRYQDPAQSLRLSLYAIDIRNLVVLVFDPLTLTTAPQNLRRARVRGAEFAWRGRWAGLDLGANATLQDPEDRDTGFQLQRRAEVFGSLTLGKTWDRYTLGAELVANGPRFDSVNENPASRMAGYALLNLTAQYRLHQDLALGLRLDNVFDRDYELARHFNTAGINAFVYLQYQPGR